MAHALTLANKAQQLGEVPVGAVLVRADQMVGEGFNQPISSQDATAHAEIQALRQAGLALQNYRLPQTTLYVTLEPCMMCAGALVHARIQRLVIGALEPKSGAIVSHPVLNSEWLNHRVEVEYDVLSSDCSALIRDFFAAKRFFAAKQKNGHK